MTQIDLALLIQMTVQVRVPYKVVGLVVGPKGTTIKRIQQQTHTYIVTPSRDKDPVFEVTGLPENVAAAKREIEAHIALRTAENDDDDDDGIDGQANGFANVMGSNRWARNSLKPFYCKQVASLVNGSLLPVILVSDFFDQATRQNNIIIRR